MTDIFKEIDGKKFLVGFNGLWFVDVLGEPNALTVIEGRNDCGKTVFLRFLHQMCQKHGVKSILVPQCRNVCSGTENLQMILKFMKADCDILFIDHPELHLHEATQRTLVYDLEATGKQVIVTSHSRIEFCRHAEANNCLISLSYDFYKTLPKTPERLERV